jgi:hypothetical protein
MLEVRVSDQGEDGMQLMPRIQLSGSPKEVGRQHGNALKAAIGRLIATPDAATIPEGKNRFAARMTEYMANSSARETFLKKQLPRVRAVDGSDPGRQLEALLEDGPGRICQTFNADQGLWTNYAALLDPARKTMRIYLGPHNRTPYQSYSLT